VAASHHPGTHSAASHPAPIVALRDAFSSPPAKREFNHRIFTTIAPRYDLITRVLSYGQDQRWKRRAIERVAPKSGECALDIACGTGDLAVGLASAGARVVALDLTLPMMQLATRRASLSPLTCVGGDICALPLSDAAFDIVTGGYALRNVPDLDGALREIARVLRRGGRFVSLDFDKPSSRALCHAYLAYLWIVGSVLGWVLHRDADTYRYIAASLRRYPGGRDVTMRLLASGFTRAERIPVLGGLMAIHVAYR
jgi:ubiquinone/menaquinone biosynthesis methyltransferase